MAFDALPTQSDHLELVDLPSRDWMRLDETNVVLFRGTPPPPPKRGRGRPKKPTGKTPVPLNEFDAIAARIQAIPPDKAGTPGRNAAKEAARVAVGRDTRLSRSAIVVFGRLIDEVQWKDGRCWRTLAWLATECGIDRRTVTRALKALSDAGHIIRRRRKGKSGGWDLSETTLPVLVKVWSDLGAENSKDRGEEMNQLGADKPLGWGRENASPRGKDAPLPLSSLYVEEEGSSAHGRETSNADAISSEQFEAFRSLADTFGRQKGAIILRPTASEDSDPILAGLVHDELGSYPQDMAMHALSAALRDATTAHIRDVQDGSAGKGRGGLPSLTRYLEKVLRGKADDLARERDISEAKSRIEKTVQQRIAAKRVAGVERAGGGPRRKGSAVADDVFEVRP